MRAIKGEVHGAVVILRDESNGDAKTVATYVNGDKVAETIFNTAEEISQFMDLSMTVLEDYSILPKMKFAANILIGSALTNYVNDRAKEHERRNGVLKMLDDMHADIQRMEKELANPLTAPLVFDKWSLSQKKKAMQDVIDEENKMIDAHMMQHNTTEELMGEEPKTDHSRELFNAISGFIIPKDLEEKLDKIFSLGRPTLSKIIDDEINALIGNTSVEPATDQADTFAEMRAGDNAEDAKYYLKCKTCDITECISRRWARVQSEETNE